MHTNCSASQVIMDRWLDVDLDLPSISQIYKGRAAVVNEADRGQMSHLVGEALSGRRLHVQVQTLYTNSSLNSTSMDFPAFSVRFQYCYWRGRDVHCAQDFVAER
jgi:hypothetical protein